MLRHARVVQPCRSGTANNTKNSRVSGCDVQTTRSGKTGPIMSLSSVFLLCSLTTPTSAASTRSSHQLQHKEQHQGTISSSKRPDPEEGTSSPNVMYKDQVREALLTSSLLGTTAGAEERAIAATIASDIPIIRAEAVSESRINAEEHENRLQKADDTQPRPKRRNGWLRRHNRWPRRTCDWHDWNNRRADTYLPYSCHNGNDVAS
jgi:hypothetical protein